ncbi:hypothetical protein [uncultured Clostridium sp.]|uniref:hypothetical protein n=1 Tax=uncultured Clostridium sp. TaxID=59620 RepID=UPI0025F374C1|nr:hypothetical protein [uncultured Clostridium sp.]
MSSLWRIKRKMKDKNEKNSILFNKDLIQYKEEQDNLDSNNSMKIGYIEMGEINLQLAIDNGSELVDINNYETWLCGV